MHSKPLTRGAYCPTPLHTCRHQYRRPHTCRLQPFQQLAEDLISILIADRSLALPTSRETEIETSHHHHNLFHSHCVDQSSRLLLPAPVHNQYCRTSTLTHKPQLALTTVLHATKSSHPTLQGTAHTTATTRRGSSRNQPFHPHPIQNDQTLLHPMPPRPHPAQINHLPHHAHGPHSPYLLHIEPHPRCLSLSQNTHIATR